MTHMGASICYGLCGLCRSGNVRPPSSSMWPIIPTAQAITSDDRRVPVPRRDEEREVPLGCESKL
jgi:hypothetical protein